MRLEGTSRDGLVSRVGRLHSLLSKLLLCPTTFTVTEIFMSPWNILYFSLCPLPLVLPLDITKRSLAPSASLPHHQILIRSDPPEPSLLQPQQPQLSQSLLVCQMLQSFCHPCGPLLASVHYAHTGHDPTLFRI